VLNLPKLTLMRKDRDAAINTTSDHLLKLNTTATKSEDHKAKMNRPSLLSQKRQETDANEC